MAQGKEPIYALELVRNGQMIARTVNPAWTAGPVAHVLWRNYYLRVDFEEREHPARLGRHQWNGTIAVDGAAIDHSLPLSIHPIHDEILDVADNTVNFISRTAGDWDGLRLELSEAARPRITFRTAFGNDNPAHTVALSAVGPDGYRHLFSDREHLLILTGTYANQPVRMRSEDSEWDDERAYYYVRALQVDGEEAWASPVFVNWD